MGFASVVVTSDGPTDSGRTKKNPAPCGDGIFEKLVSWLVLSDGCYDYVDLAVQLIERDVAILQCEEGGVTAHADIGAAGKKSKLFPLEGKLAAGHFVRV